MVGNTDYVSEARMISDSDTFNVEHSHYTVAQVSGIFSASSGIFNETSTI